MHTLTFWAVVQSDLLASGQNQTLAWSSNYGTILLDVLAIIFLLFGLFVFLSFLRKETSIRGDGGFRRPKNAGFQRSRSRAGLLSLFVLALPLIALFFTGSGILAQISSFKPTPTPIPTRAPGPVVTPSLIKSGFLTVGSDTTYPPQEYLDGNNAKGFDIDLITAIAKKMRLKVKVISDTSDKLITDLVGNKFDVAISALPIISDSQQAEYIPYLNSVESLVVLKGASQNIKSLNDLCGMNIGVLTGSSVQSDFNDAKTTCANAGKGDITLTPEPDTKTIIQMLQSKKIDVAYMDAPVANYYVTQNKNTLMIVGNPVSEKIQEGIAIRQGDTAMFNAVQQAFRALQRDGTYDKLLKANAWDFTSESL